MQYVYFGLIPLLLAVWFVFRENYKTDGAPDPLTRKDYRNVNFVYLVIFASIYFWFFGITAALFSAAIVLVIRGIWGNAVRKKLLKDWEQMAGKPTKADGEYGSLSEEQRLELMKKVKRARSDVKAYSKRK
jgi:vacuolar-type H+-ATPase subunit I/STV1